MSAQMKCPFCDEPFDADSSAGRLSVTCPHCGKATVVGSAAANAHPHLRVLRDAPSLMGSKACPRCQAPIEADAVICVHCGYNLASGKQTHGAGAFPLGKRLVQLGVFAVLILAACAIYGQRSKIASLAGQWRTAETPAKPDAAQPAAPDVRSPDAEPVAPPPDAGSQTIPSGTPAKSDRADLEPGNARREEALRRKLDAAAPLRKPGDNVDLRRKNGQVVAGTLLGLAGDGTARIATSAGEIRIELAALDQPSRLGIDSGYREEYVRRALAATNATVRSPGPAPRKPGVAPETRSAAGAPPRPATPPKVAAAKPQAAVRPDGQAFRVYDTMFLGHLARDDSKNEYGRFSIRNYSGQPLDGWAYATEDSQQYYKAKIRISVPPDSQQEGIRIRATKQCHLIIDCNHGRKEVGWREDK